MPGRAARRGEDGTSPVVASFAVAAFLSFLLLAVQVLVHLATVSTAGATAADAARRAAAVGAGCDDARRHAAALLGTWGDDAEVICRRDGGVVEVTVRGPSPSGLARAAGGVGTVERAARVALETDTEVAGAPP